MGVTEVGNHAPPFSDTPRPTLIPSPFAVARAGHARLTDALGGPARRRAVLMLAAVLSLSSADVGAVGAMAAQLERAFRVGNTQVGLLVTVSSLVGAGAALPIGVLADRTNRTRILVISIALWAATMVATGLATSFTVLIITRLALGVVMAASGPTIASLVGDLFPARERSQVYGYILTGELFGGGIGLLVSGAIGTALGWRWAFFVLAVPSLALAAAIRRFFPEPGRGGQSWLHPGAVELKAAVDGDGSSTSHAEASEPLADRAAVSEVRRRARRRPDVEIDESLVLKEDPNIMSMWSAARYVLAIPSNRAMILSSALGYFFLGGLQTFAVLFAEGHFRVSYGAVSGLLVVVGAGAVLGTLAGGGLADRLIRRGLTEGRVVLAGAAFVVLSFVMLPGLISSSLFVSVPILVIGAGLLGSTNPPLDAARLDIVPSRLWGRGEAVRTFVRTIFQAFAPLLFGYVSSVLSGGGASGLSGGFNNAHQHVSAGQARGLEYTFLIMLAPLVASGLILLKYRHRYLRDVATADASELQSTPGRRTPSRV